MFKTIVTATVLAITSTSVFAETAGEQFVEQYNTQTEQLVEISLVLGSMLHDEKQNNIVLNEKLDNKRERIEELKEDKDVLESQIDELESSIGDMEENFMDAAEAMSDIIQSYDEVLSEVDLDAVDNLLSQLASAGIEF